MTLPDKGLRWTNIGRFDGSEWRIYDTPDTVFMLTRVGRKLFAQRGISRVLHTYFADQQSGNNSANDTRQFLVEGANARVYSVRSELPLVIKEAKPDATDSDLMASLLRMDRLKDVIEKHCPRWIDIPKHYGVVWDRQADQKFLIMEKIDCGVTVGDIVLAGTQNPARRPEMELRARREFGVITPQLQEEVTSRYYDLKGILRKALVGEYLGVDTYLPDIDHNPHNVALERLVAPIASSTMRYWVIDQ